ncbi:MAG: heparinase II/III family protein [Kiritimatiellaeota bacterium]|nr:heparinase II/III family protein [Kiritimatiellota bacterium]
MDIGTFVMDADGVRWAEDLGMQDYHSLESKGVNLWGNQQNAERWQIFRLGSLSHNTLVVDGKLQLVKGRAPLTLSTQQHSLVDLSAVYAGQLAKAVRGVALRPDRTVLVQDEIQATSAPAKVRWGMVTSADVKVTGSSALLQRDGKQLALRVLSPAGAVIRLYPTDPPPGKYDARNEGTRMVGFEVTLPAAGKQTLTVALIPGGKTDLPIPLKPLANW